MSNQNQNTNPITSEKLLETIGLQTVELNIHRANNAQLIAENQRLSDLLNAQKGTVKAESA